MMSRLLLISFFCCTLFACVDGGGSRSNDPAPEPARDTGHDSAQDTQAQDTQAQDTQEDAPRADVPPGMDQDMDGVPTPADCDDNNPRVFPGATEDCTTELDEDCDGHGGQDDTDCDDDVDEDMDEDSDEDMDEDSDEDMDENSDES